MKNMVIGFAILIALVVITASMSGMVAEIQTSKTMKAQDGYQVIFDKLKPDQEAK